MITIRFKQSLDIDQPAQEIFDYMSDLDNLIDWSSTAITVRKLSSGSIGVGTRVSSTIRFWGKWMTLTFEIVEYEPARYLTLKSISGIAPSFFCYQFEPRADGGTTLLQEAMLHLTEEMAEPTASIVARAVRRQLEYDLLTLKDLLEVRASVSRIAD